MNMNNDYSWFDPCAEYASPIAIQEDPLVMTLDDDTIEIEFPLDWHQGRQYNWMSSQFTDWHRTSARMVRILLSQSLRKALC